MATQLTAERCLRNAAVAVAATIAAAGLTWAQNAPAPAATPALTLRVVGGLAGLNQFTRNEEPFWTKELPKLTAVPNAAAAA